MQAFAFKVFFNEPFDIRSRMLWLEACLQYLRQLQLSVKTSLRVLKMVYNFHLQALG